MGTFHPNLMLHNAGKYIKTNNTPPSPKPAFLQVLSTGGKAEFGATLTFHNVYVQVVPPHHPVGLCKEV